MKREVFATLLITAIVLRGLFATFNEVEDDIATNSDRILGYNELVDQKLIFDDEFDGSIDSKWDIQDDQTKYNRLSVNQAENVELNDEGELVLTTKQEEDGSISTPYMTVSEDDNGNKFNYGYYEARVKFTNNNEYDEDESLIPGTNILKPWGAFWLYPLENGSGLGTEIDVVENSIVGKVTGSIHELDNYSALEEDIASSWFKGNEYDLVPSIYHRYGVYIEPNGTENSANFTLYINGDKIATITSTHPLSNQTIHLSMEVATEDYEEGRQGQPIPDYDGVLEEHMIVDYVRVYEYNPDLHVKVDSNM